MKKYQVYGIGNALLDIEYDVSPQFLTKNGIEKGVMTLVDETRQAAIVKALGFDNINEVACGGSAANAMMVLTYFGGKGFYSCKIANDEAGDHFYRDMSESGLASNFDRQKRSGGHTGKSLVMVTEDTDRTMNTFLGISETLSPHEVDIEAIKAADYVYIEGYLMTSPTAFEAVKLVEATAKAHSVKTSISLSDPMIAMHCKSQFKEVIGEGVDLLFCNEKEALAFTETDTLAEAQKLLKYFAKRYVITLGAQGSMVFDGSELIHIVPEKVEAIDTVGAGDMYAGAFLYGITHGMDFAEAGQLASLTSATVVTQYGPRISPEQAQMILAELKAPA